MRPKKLNQEETAVYTERCAGQEDFPAHRARIARQQLAECCLSPSAGASEDYAFPGRYSQIQSIYDRGFLTAAIKERKIMSFQHHISPLSPDAGTVPSRLCTLSEGSVPLHGSHLHISGTVRRKGILFVLFPHMAGFPRQL